MKRTDLKKADWDVIVVGAGIAGLGVARALVLKKKRVLVLEKPVRGASSSNASGILDPFVDLDFRPSILGVTIPALKGYGRWIKQIEKATGFSTGYEKRPLLYTATSKAEETKLKRFLYIRGVRQVMRVRWLERDEILRLESEIDSGVRGGLYLPEVARVLPAKLMRTMRAWLKKQGVVFQSVSVAPELLIEKNRTLGIKVGSRSFRAEKVVGCLGAWASIEEKQTGLRQPVQAVRGQLAVYRRKNPLKVLLHTANGGYLIPWAKERVLAGSTVEKNRFDAITDKQGLRQIHQHVIKMLPELADASPIQSWSGIRPGSLSGSPRIGKTSVSGYYVANGYYRCGILVGVYAGELLARLMLTGKTPVELRPFKVKS